ncbi:MAG: glycine oxidase, partial [Polaribacter sp.]
MIDYLIIGCGLAGIAFSEIALQNGKTVFVMDNNSQSSSKIAGGLYNPVILKRFSEVWKAQEQLVFMDAFYTTVEDKIKTKVDFKKPILRKFFSVEEQNNWFAASDKKSLAPFLSTELIKKKYSGIE